MEELSSLVPPWSAPWSAVCVGFRSVKAATRRVLLFINAFGLLIKSTANWSWLLNGGWLWISYLFVALGACSLAWKRWLLSARHRGVCSERRQSVSSAAYYCSVIYGGGGVCVSRHSSYSTSSRCVLSVSRSCGIGVFRLLFIRCTGIHHGQYVSTITKWSSRHYFTLFL